MRRTWALGLIAPVLSITAASVFAQSAVSVFKDCPGCAEMVVVPAGSYLMGSTPDPAIKFKPGPEEQPQHQVTLKSFVLGKYEITQEQWSAVMGNNPSTYQGRSLPVQQVSWDDIHVFIQKLNAKTGAS